MANPSPAPEFCRAKTGKIDYIPGSDYWERFRDGGLMPYPVGAILKRRASGGIPVISWLFGFSHMGIYLGDGHVVHLWSPTGHHRRYARVRRDSLRTFAQGRKIYLHKTPRDFRHSRAIVAEAVRLLSGTRDAEGIPNISAKPPVTSSRALCARCYRANG